MIQVEGNMVDVYNRRIFSGTIYIDQGIIVNIVENRNTYTNYIAPGFIDAHVHIESSMLLPEEFSKLVISKGTVAIVNDPHEIANVLGVDGILFMLEHAKGSLIKTFFSIPSCVPATPYDCSGAIITSHDIKNLLDSKVFVALSEMMNVSGVIHHDPETIRKIQLAQGYDLKIDGHAPGLNGADLLKYIQAGISTDHEAASLSEALEKIALGMKILIREGSAAKNYEALKSLIKSHPESVMFCTDDSHPDDLIKSGHIDKLVKRAVADGFDLFQILNMACIHPIKHYNLPVGTLRIGDPADFCIFKDLKSFDVQAVYINGEQKYNKEQSISASEIRPFGRQTVLCNKFERNFITCSDLRKAVYSDILCIKVYEGSLMTDKVVFSVDTPTENFESDINRDILKIVYLNRYENKPPQIAFIHGVGLKRGAFATSISHDSHNIIAVGCDDQELLVAINTIIASKGGLSVVSEGEIETLPLPIAGIMTDRPGYEVASIWDKLIHILHKNGCILTSPFMTLSFMALIVIPELKIGEKGLFEYSKFNFLEN